jgi:hypothetical protein
MRACQRIVHLWEECRKDSRILAQIKATDKRWSSTHCTDIPSSLKGLLLCLAAPHQVGLVRDGADTRDHYIYDDALDCAREV